MFSGIIERIEKPTVFKKERDSLSITFQLPGNWNIHLGASVAIDGICATVKDMDKKSFSVYFMPETISKTTLAYLSSDHTFNLELPLTLQSVVGGHLVSGHVDTTGTIEKIAHQQEAKVLTISLNKEFTKYLVYKGSVCVNGVSLTVATTTNNDFTVCLIPYTLSHTNLGLLTKGDKVNIEVDFLAKYIERFVKPYNL